MALNMDSTSPFSSTRRSYTNADKGQGELRHEWERAPAGGVLTRTYAPVREDAPLDDGSEMTPMVANEPAPDENAHKLDQFRATAIAGNDITSSCLYSAGITLSAGGIAAPISCFLLVFVLSMFRGIYSEVCSGLPMNGGTYNALLNTTAKWVAALASILSLVSYTATAVTSAASASEYLHYQWDSVPALWLAVGILVLFALLNLFGISESANSAAFLFALHLLTMTVLIVTATVYVIGDRGSTLHDSFHSNSTAANPKGNWGGNIFNGYCAALLGVTGFETSANYIEEQRPGVFPKTLRNMWIAVSLLNPTLILLAIGVVPIENIVADSDFSLAAVAHKSGGEWLKTWVVVDATLVLSGAVLTSYVGIGGLMRRMAGDQLLPSFFSHTNKWRGTNHWIIIGFCVLTCSLRLLVRDMNTLGGVYAIAFLGVMCLFAISNLALKFKRGGLKRTPIVPSHWVFLALAFVFAGMVGNFERSAKNAEFFLLYFVAFSIVVVACIWRIPILRSAAAVFDKISPSFAAKIRESINAIRAHKVMFFTKTASAARLNKVVTYVTDNEDTTNIIVVYCRGGHCEGESEEPTDFAAKLEEACSILDNLYPKLTIELLLVDAPFCPQTLNELSSEFSVPKNFMFITCPNDKFPHDISRFGGLRVISY